MMLPDITTSPPNFFTPSLLPAESRPFLELPPAFLCAMSYPIFFTAFFLTVVFFNAAFLFVDAFLLVNWVRMVKSTKEILYMKQAGQIANLAMKKTMSKVKPGIRQCDVIAELYKVTTGGTNKIGGTFTCKPPNAMVGKYCSAPHLSWTDDKLKKNEIFYIELGGAKHRYHVPLARCIFVGKAPKKIIEISKIINEGLNCVLDKVKPGVRIVKKCLIFSEKSPF